MIRYLVAVRLVLILWSDHLKSSTESGVSDSYSHEIPGHGQGLWKIHRQIWLQWPKEDTSFENPEVVWSTRVSDFGVYPETALRINVRKQLLCSDCWVGSVIFLIVKDESPRLVTGLQDPASVVSLELPQEILHTLVTHLLVYRETIPLDQIVHLPLQEHNSGWSQHGLCLPLIYKYVESWCLES